MKDEYKIGIIGYTGMVGSEIASIFEKGAYGMIKPSSPKFTIAYKRNSTDDEGKLSECDVVFLATKDQASLDSVEECLEAGAKVIDMSGAFRLDKEKFEKWYKIEHTKPALFEKAVYGMPALNRDKIKNAVLVANPGCYATSVILSLNPIRDLVTGEATVVSTSGNSGARKTVEDVSDDWAYSYGHKHKHVPEMAMYSGVKVNFTPIVLRSVFKGINTNIRVQLVDELAKLPAAEAATILEDRIKAAYKPEDQVFVVRDSKEQSYGTKFVNDSNKMCIKVNVEDGYAYINACIDNLGKGAASQAVQNFMIMMGLE